MREEYDFSNAKPNPYVKDLRKYEDDGSYTTEYENIMQGLKEAVEYQEGTLEARETTLVIDQFNEISVREEYDFSNARPNPYVKDLRKQVQ